MPDPLSSRPGQAPRLGIALTRPPRAGEPLANPKARLPLEPEFGLYCAVDFRTISTATWTTRVPQGVVDAFLAPGSCLVVGDTPGDPDCFGSAIGWARARRGLRLEAEAHVAAPPAKPIAGLLAPGELSSSEQIQGRSFETVVLVDNDGTRIGPAATEAMRRAKRVVVVDHHDVNPTKESLGLGPETELIVWKELGADAAALMTMAVMLRGLESAQASWTTEGWREVLSPLIAAIYSDTRGFEASKASPVTMQLLRGIINAGELDLATLLRPFEGPLPAPIHRRLVDAIEERVETHGGERLGIFQLSGRAFLEAWLAARAESPEVTWSDTLFAALDYVEIHSQMAGHEVSLFAVSMGPEDRALVDPTLHHQLPEQTLKFSIRSVEPSTAAALAKALGGNGKPHEAGGNSEEAPAELFARASAWLQHRAELKAHAQLWVRGS